MAAKRKTEPAEELSWHSYLDLSRTLPASFVFVAPLLILYHIGVLGYPQAHNGAQPLLDQLLHRLRHLGPEFFSFLLIGLICLAVWLTRKKQPHQRGIYALMFLESCGWAALMMIAALLLPVGQLSIEGEGDWFGRALQHAEALAPEVIGAAGAGVYEEAVFRLILLGGMIQVLTRYFGADPRWVVPVAILVSAIVFSYAHHGLGGEPWGRRVFAIRTAMGLFLGGIYWARGIGIAVYAHALYNVVLAVVNHF